MHKRIQREQKVITLMINKFCKEYHSSESLCADCTDLLSYAEKRLLKCPYIKNKPVCSNCDIHCYNKQQKDKIKQVMRTIGPKMIYTHTLDTLWYLFYKFIHKYQRVT